MLEKSLAKIVEDFEKEKEILKFNAEKEVREQDEEIITSKDILKLKDQEIRNIRALAQMILDQRTDIEQFFIESLEQVKYEKKQERM